MHIHRDVPLAIALEAIPRDAYARLEFEFARAIANCDATADHHTPRRTAADHCRVRHARGLLGRVNRGVNRLWARLYEGQASQIGSCCSFDVSSRLLSASVACGWRDDAREVSGRRGSAGGCVAPLCSSLPCMSRRERCSSRFRFGASFVSLFSCVSGPTSQAVRPFYRVSLHPLHALSTDVLFLPVASLLPTPPPLWADSAEQHSSRWVRGTAACVRSMRCMQQDGACLTTLLLHSPPRLPLASLPTSQRCFLSFFFLHRMFAALSVRRGDDSV
jgi:hypothetical protein